VGKSYGRGLVQRRETWLVIIGLVVVVLIALTGRGGDDSYHEEHGDCPSYQVECDTDNKPETFASTSTVY